MVVCIARKYNGKNPENPQPERLNPSDVPVDYQLIDYIAHENNLELFDPEKDGLKKSHSVSLRAAGWTNVEIAEGLEVSRSVIEIWEQTDELYKHCIEFVRKMETKDAEQKLWQQALRLNSASREREFAIKARLPEYRENAAPPTNVITQLRISLDGKDIDVSANMKPLLDAGPDPDDD